ncbi:winged helix-turn-helix domain-containing protein [Rhodococcus sp. NPDC003348]
MVRQLEPPVGPTSRRPRSGPPAVFPIPRQRLAIVGAAADHPSVQAAQRSAEKLGWPYLLVTDRTEAVWAITVNKPALVVVAGGETPVCLEDVTAIRNGYKGPIVMLDNLSPSTTVSALVTGADTVLSPDLRDDELGARLLALVRRTAEGSESGARFLTSGGLSVDLWRKEVTLDRTPLRLSSTEFRLLVCLMESAGQNVPVNRILHRVWGWADADVNMLRIYVTRLRKALGEKASSPRFVRSVRGHGYMFAGSVIEAGDRESDVVEGELPMMQRLAAKCAELAATTDVGSAAERIVSGLVTEGTVDAVGLHLLDGDVLRLIAHSGFTTAWEDMARELTVADGRFASTQAVTTAAPVQVLRLRTRTFPGTSEACGAESPGNYLFVPLMYAGKAIGAMGVLRHSIEPIGPLTLSYLSAVAALCGTCLGPRWTDQLMPLTSAGAASPTQPHQ